MAAPTGSLFSTHTNRIEEVINKNVEVFLPMIDPVWRNTIVSSQGVGPADALGRDWKMLKVYMGSYTGVIEGGGPKQDFVLYGDPQDTHLGATVNERKVHLKGLGNVWPDPTKGPNATPFRLGIPMRSILTNYMMTLGELQAEATPAFIGEVIAPKLEGFARNISHYLCNYFYLSQNQYYRLFATPDVSANITYADSNKKAIIDLTADNHAVHRLFTGQRLTAYDTTGTTARTSGGGSSTLIVDAVDELTGAVWVRADDDGTLNSSFSDGDIFVFASTKGSATTPFSASPYFTGIAGINSWLKGGSGGNDNYLLGAERDTNNAIDVTVHPEFKSFTKNMSGDALTEHTLRKITRRFHAAKHRYGQEIDAFIGSDGVWLAYEATRIGREQVDRTGRLASMRKQGTDEMEKGGGFVFEFDGRRYVGHTSYMIEDGTVYGLKLGGNNWKRYVPPDPKGVQSGGRMDSFIPFRFVASALTGTSSNQLPIFTTDGGDGDISQVTEGVQYPGWIRMQLVPDQPAGLKLTNVGTDRLYSDN